MASTLWTVHASPCSSDCYIGPNLSPRKHQDKKYVCSCKITPRSHWSFLSGLDLSVSKQCNICVLYPATTALLRGEMCSTSFNSSPTALPSQARFPQRGGNLGVIFSRQTTTHKSLILFRWIAKKKPNLHPSFYHQRLPGWKKGNKSSTFSLCGRLSTWTQGCLH